MLARALIKIRNQDSINSFLSLQKINYIWEESIQNIIKEVTHPFQHAAHSAWKEGRGDRDANPMEGSCWETSNSQLQLSSRKGHHSSSVTHTPLP